MKTEELIPGQFYYCENHHDGCKYFIFLKHNENFYTIKALDGILYNGHYIQKNKFRKMTDEEKLKLL